MPSLNRWLKVSRPPLRISVPIASSPYNTVVSGNPNTPASTRAVPPALVVTRGGVLRPRLNHTRYSKRNVLIAQSQLQQSLKQLLLQLSQPPLQPQPLLAPQDGLVASK